MERARRPAGDDAFEFVRAHEATSAHAASSSFAAAFLLAGVLIALLAAVRAPAEIVGLLASGGVERLGGGGEGVPGHRLEVIESREFIADESLGAAESIDAERRGRLAGGDDARAGQEPLVRALRGPVFRLLSREELEDARGGGVVRGGGSFAPGPPTGIPVSAASTSTSAASAASSSFAVAVSRASAFPPAVVDVSTVGSRRPLRMRSTSTPHMASLVMTSIFALAGTFLSLARLDRDGCAARGSPNADRRARDARDDRDARAQHRSEARTSKGSKRATAW